MCLGLGRGRRDTGAIRFTYRQNLEGSPLPWELPLDHPFLVFSNKNSMSDDDIQDSLSETEKKEGTVPLTFM